MMKTYLVFLMCTWSDQDFSQNTLVLEYCLVAFSGLFGLRTVDFLVNVPNKETFKLYYTNRKKKRKPFN